MPKNYYRIAKPPSTRMVSPVTKSDAFEDKYTAVPIISSGQSKISN